MALVENTKNSAASDGSTTTVDVALTGIASGDLVIAYCKWEGADTTITVADTGATDSFTAGTKTNHSNNDLNGQFFFFLAATITGSVTYRMTLSAARPWKKFYVLAVTPDGSDTVSLDVQNVGQGSSTATASGQISPTGSDIITVGGHSEYGGQSESAHQINGTTTGVVVQAQGTGSLWYKIDTSGFTNGTADVTLFSSVDWVCNVISFKSVAAGGGRIMSSLASHGGLAGLGGIAGNGGGLAG